jgi:hypothetical protein
MGLPRALVISNFYVESFEEQTIRFAIRKPAHWCIYMDDTFVVWTHGKEVLQGFVHFNCSHPSMKFKFAAEVEQ